MLKSIKCALLLAACCVIFAGCDNDTMTPQPAASIALQATEDGAAAVSITYGRGLSAQDSANADYAIKSALNVGFDSLAKTAERHQRETERKSNRDMTVIVGIFSMIGTLLTVFMVCGTVIIKEILKYRLIHI